MDSPIDFRALVESASDLVLVVSLDGNVEYVNRAWLDAMGYTPDEAMALTVDEIMTPDSSEAYWEAIQAIRGGATMMSLDVRMLTKSGEVLILEGNLFPRVEEGQVVGVQGIYHDISARRLAEEEARRSHARTEFLLDLMTHDLMNINQEVLSTFELLLRHGGLTDDMRVIVREGVAEVDRATKLIGKMKKLIHIETSPPVPKVLDLGDVLFSVAAEIESEFPDKTLDLRTELQRGQVTVLADEYLSDVFRGLLHNSMKYDPSDTVRVDVNVRRMPRTPFVRVEVSDYGPGIADERKESVFARLSDITDRKESVLGLGIGLALVRTIVEHYGGQIHVEDRVPGDHTKGARFVLLLRTATTGAGGTQ